MAKDSINRGQTLTHEKIYCLKDIWLDDYPYKRTTFDHTQEQQYLQLIRKSWFSASI